jgi:hypothetical protein
MFDFAAIFPFRVKMDIQYRPTPLGCLRQRDWRGKGACKKRSSARHAVYRNSLGT